MNRPVEGQDEVLEVGTVLADPSASCWLKQSIESALQRDPVDALNDALVLAAILDGHLRNALDLNDPA